MLIAAFKQHHLHFSSSGNPQHCARSEISLKIWNFRLRAIDRLWSLCFNGNEKSTEKKLSVSECENVTQSGRWFCYQYLPKHQIVTFFWMEHKVVQADPCHVSELWSHGQNPDVYPQADRVQREIGKVLALIFECWKQESADVDLCLTESTAHVNFANGPASGQ